MKVQSQFQSQVQSVVKKDDTKTSENNQVNYLIKVGFLFLLLIEIIICNLYFVFEIFWVIVEYMSN